MRRALIVDDSEANRRLPALILGQLGWDCVEAGDARSALEAFKTQSFDCVLLDLLLPDMSGVRVCHFLRRLPHGHEIRIVAYTASPDEDMEASLQMSGFDAVLKKPLSRQSLLDALGNSPEDTLLSLRV
jgi:CheY-like chemotaxis protein